MSKHSAAPWTIHIDEHGDKYLKSADGNDMMCDTPYYPWTPSEHADWLLIAAAPELLEALKTSKLFVEAMIEEQRCGDMFTAAALMLDKINHVINKATGEQP
jgi:hypothetical protein